MRKALSLTLAAVVATSPFTSIAVAATRLVVVPVVVGGGNEPDAALMAALGEGLRQNPQWAVVQGDAVPTLARSQTTAMTDAEQTKVGQVLDEAGRRLGTAPEEAVTALERMRSDLRALAKKAPLGPKGDDLAWRTSTLLVTALHAAKHDEKAKQAADETTLLFPGRKVQSADHLPAPVAQLLSSPTPNLGAKVTITSRPEGCEIVVNDTGLGKGPAEIGVLQGDAYWAQARCPAAGGAAALTTTPKKILLPANETARQELLDADFERAFVAEGLRRVRFSSPQERRQLEDTTARRLAERFDADGVVLASVGELSGSDWLNARLYLRSGYLNRQGLVRLEAQRANALGRFLATGKDVPGVLRPEDAGALLAGGKSGSTDMPQPVADPWYTDVTGWVFLGVGLTTLGIGRWGAAIADRKQSDADAVRGDSDRQQRLYQDAQSAKFWSGIGTVGGLLLTATGIVLLAVPEYTSTHSELLGFAPAVIPGGGGLSMSGRF